MSTALTLPDAPPSYLAALIAANPELAEINQQALSGSGKPMPPTIVANKGKFTKKVAGEETAIVFPDNDQNRAAGIVGMPMPQLQAVVLKAKPGKEKAWYKEKYTPGQENQSPDCSSDDGITPLPDSRDLQCTNCASCPQNVFGSGTDASGNPGKGKACADKKVIAIYAAGSAYRFAVPPSSLKNWDTYCNQLTTKGLPLPAVITTIGFEQGDTDYKLTFSFGGMLAEKQLEAVVKMLATPEVAEIVTPRNAPLALAHTPVAQVEDKTSELEAARAKADAEKKEKAEKAKAKKEKEAADKAAAAAGAGALDLGLGEETAANAANAANAAAGSSDEDLIASLSL